MATIKEVADRCWQDAEDKGWHEPKREFGSLIALAHSELSEALEEARLRTTEEMHTTYYEDDDRVGPGTKPCGIPSELADAVIRIFDTAGELGIDIEAAIHEKLDFNAKRAHRHGGKAF